MPPRTTAPLRSARGTSSTAATAAAKAVKPRKQPAATISPTLSNRSASTHSATNARTKRSSATSDTTSTTHQRKPSTGPAKPVPGLAARNRQHLKQAVDSLIRSQRVFAANMASAPSPTAQRPAVVRSRNNSGLLFGLTYEALQQQQLLGTQDAWRIIASNL
jgi:hypothetical protein